jgi:hypothetical protein
MQSVADEAQGEQARDRSEERRLTCHPKPSAAIKSQSEVIKSQSLPTIRSHERPSTAMSDHQWSSEFNKSQSELIKSQSELIKSQSELIKSQSELIKSQSELIKSQSELIKSQSDSPAPERPTMATWSPAPIEIVSRCIVGRPCGGYDS